MKRIILSTESVADLPKEFIEENQIQIMPMHVIMDGKGYFENELSVQTVFDYYHLTKKIPSTSAANVQEYHNFFSRIRRDFPDSIILHLGYTSKASASFQSAQIAAQDFEDLFLIDTLNVTGGLAAIVMYAVTSLKHNPTIHHIELMKNIESIIPKTRLAFVPNTLDFLRAGGRVSNFAYIGGSLLKIKPCIEIKEGKLIPTRKYRGSMSSVSEKLMRDFLNQYKVKREQLYFIYSIGLDQSIKSRMDALAIEAGFEHIIWIQAGPTISTHAGPWCFGIAGIEE